MDTEDSSSSSTSNSSSDEPEHKKKRTTPHPLSNMARNSTSSPSHDNPVDATVLQYQNQQLVQQLDKQKHELQAVEAKIKELKDMQTGYDEMLISVNRLWNQLVDDLVLLGIQSGCDKSILQTLDNVDISRGSVPSCAAEEIFLCRLLQVDSIENSGSEIVRNVEEALSLRYESTRKLMKFLEDTLNIQKSTTMSMAQAFHGKLSAEDAIIQMSKIDELLKDEAENFRKAIDAISLKHKMYAEEVQKYIQSHSVDQSEIKRLTGELEETMAELEESRRRYINIKMQKDIATGVQIHGAVNGNLSPEKSSDKSKGSRELRDAIEEAKVLAADRLVELEDMREDNQALLTQVQDVEDELKDEKYIHASRPYASLNDQLQHWNAEAERYRILTESLQADRSSVVRREKELHMKADSADIAKSSTDNAESKIEVQELQLQNCIIEKNDLEIKMEEAFQDSGRNDIKAEFKVMASALSREMEMMEAQLNRWKETAAEALSLREKSQSMKAVLHMKTNEQKSIEEKCAEQTKEIRALKVVIEKLQKEKLELQIVLDMHGQEMNDNRDLVEIKESERRAHSQAEALQLALDEHSLELRVKAAIEAETACQQRLFAAEAEKTELRAKLDASERDVLELTEAIKIKDREAEAYMSEMETIGQAYEDMQTQNQHLLQQVTERDEYNIKLVSGSVKTKHVHSFLISEKQALAKQLQQLKASLECVKSRISHSEEQIKSCISEAGNYTLEDRHLAVSLETAKWELADAEKELKWLKSAASSSDKENEQIQRKMDEFQKELDTERNERKKVEEELAEVNRMVAELSSETGEAAVHRLQEEIKECKSILKCGVCFDRPKEVVIVKCYHLFCNSCIQRNLEIRHRKCPACGTAFGQSDVRFVKI